MTKAVESIQFSDYCVSLVTTPPVSDESDFVLAYKSEPTFLLDRHELVEQDATCFQGQGAKAWLTIAAHLASAVRVGGGTLQTLTKIGERFHVVEASIDESVEGVVFFNNRARPATKAG